jgi:flagellar hook assembly protein FlgD
VSVYNLLGQQIRQFSFAGESAAGSTQVVWDATTEQGVKVASGVYIIRADIMNEARTIQTSALTKVIYLK